MTVELIQNGRSIHILKIGIVVGPYLLHKFDTQFASGRGRSKDLKPSLTSICEVFKGKGGVVFVEQGRKPNVAEKSKIFPSPLAVAVASQPRLVEL
jgi:hypothetical protein